MSKSEVRKMHRSQIVKLAQAYLDAKRDMRKAGVL
jgi:hypothetical protein